MEHGVTLSVPYTSSTTTVRRRFGRVPSPGEVSADLERFLREYEGWIGNIILSALTRVRCHVDTEIRRVVRVYSTRREAYVAWWTLFFDCLDLFRGRVGRTTDAESSSSEDSDSEDEHGGGDGAAGGVGDASGGGGGSGAAPPLVVFG